MRLRPSLVDPCGKQLRLLRALLGREHPQSFPALMRQGERETLDDVGLRSSLARDGVAASLGALRAVGQRGELIELIEHRHHRP